MDGWKISFFLSMDPYTRKYFKGFAMSDFLELPHQNNAESLYILNTDKSTGPGNHWCLFFCYGNKGEFFDPFGMHPDVYDLTHLFKHYTVVYNAQQVQNVFSKVCGNHCLFFAYYRSRGYSLNNILGMYDVSNTEKNDMMVTNFMLKFGKVYSLK